MRKVTDHFRLNLWFFLGVCTFTLTVFCETRPARGGTGVGQSVNSYSNFINVIKSLQLQTSVKHFYSSSNSAVFIECRMTVFILDDSCYSSLFGIGYQAKEVSLDAMCM
jgi:hypothetical protein